MSALSEGSSLIMYDEIDLNNDAGPCVRRVPALSLRLRMRLACLAYALRVHCSPSPQQHKQSLVHCMGNMRSLASACRHAYQEDISWNFAGEVWELSHQTTQVTTPQLQL